MRLINWNISAFNMDVEKALNYILSYDPDILCIQELAQNGVDYLNKLSNYNITYCMDTEARRKLKNVFLVILTKQKIVNMGIYDYSKGKINSPFLWCSERFFGRKKQTKSLYADINIAGNIKRVHNIHLSWPVGPATRIKQFWCFLDTVKPTQSDLILGDLNVFGKTRNNILACIPFGYSLQEFYIDEKAVFNNFFERYGWQNPFEGTISPTWPWTFSGAQLDYILISKDLVIKNKFLLKETYGSDHRPQVLETD